MALSKKSNSTDDLTFKEAFKFFRKKHGGDGGRFKWKGEVYTTDFAKSKTGKPNFITDLPKANPKGPSKRPGIKSPGRAEAMSGPKPKAKPKKPSRSIGSGWTGTKKTSLGKKNPK